MSYEIRLDGLRKVYPDGTEALSRVDLVCPPGKTTTLVGPSGSGKSTILKIVAGLLEPSEGAVLFDGRDVTYLLPEKRNIGMVFQSYALFPNMTVQENVEFGLLVRGVAASERRRKAMEALEVVQITSLAHRRTHQLSGGQQQRVALARAVVFSPDILLLDEPLSALDAKIRHELRAELARLLGQFAITAVYVTHDQQEAMSLGDQVVVMDHGRIMQVGSPYDVYARPASTFVANFIGTANLFDGEVEVAADGARTVRLGFARIPLPRNVTTVHSPAPAAGRCQVVCRPQDVAIVGEERAHARVVVEERLFLGDRIRIAGRTTSGEAMQIEGHNSLDIKIGDTLPVAIALEHMHFIPKDPPGAR
ncbi:MAG: ATP-binding cassette domain-containing protein [Rhizobiales bacterium]|nr:ATP-binding cassette domain-containing protein [Hyphomicrobiales bacterium]